eukprot:13847865-Ditylum_brightwellii.AAC.1
MAKILIINFRKSNIKQLVLRKGCAPKWTKGALIPIRANVVKGFVDKQRQEDQKVILRSDR